MENQNKITVKDAIKMLLEYPMDKELTVYDRETKTNKPIMYIGASPNDQGAWYDDNEMPHLVSWVEILI